MKKFMLGLFMAAFTLPALAAITADVVPGPWDLYRATAIEVQDLPTLEACVQAAKDIGLTRKYTCRTRANVSVVVTVDPPPAVNCAGVWNDWLPDGEWSACANSLRTRPEQRNFTVTTAPANGGVACPSSPELRTVNQACQSPPVGQVLYVNPGENISTAVAQLQPGGTVIIRAGTYAPFTPKACTAANWCTVKAEVDGAVTITGLAIGQGNWYLRMEGLKFTGNSAKAINGSYVKVFRTAFVGGPASGNDMAVQIGTNNYTPGATFVLLEDCWAYGVGGRYKFLVYNATDVVLRRLVSRYDGSSQGAGSPQADISVYDSARVEVQNSIALDTVTGAGSSEYVAAFYNPVNGGTPTPNNTRAYRGNIALNIHGYYMGTEGQSNMTGLVVEDGAGINLEWGISQLKGTNTIYRRLTFVNTLQGGFYRASGSTATYNDSVIVASGGQALNGATCSTCSVYATLPAAKTAGLQWLTQPVSSNGRGATILKRVGVSGTLYGEAGFNTLTDEDLWPFPNEVRIKSDFDTVKPSFGGKSLTNYVWEQLGVLRP